MTARPSFDEKCIDGLAAAAQAHPEAVALIDLGTARRFTHRQLYQRVCRLAEAWRTTYRVQSGDRVMVLARNSTDVYEMLFAAWRIGAVFMPVNWRLAPAELDAIITDARPALCVVDEDFIDKIAASKIALQKRSPDLASSDYEADLQKTPATEIKFTPTPDTMNTLLYTSGTTGQPKGVIGIWGMTATMLAQSNTLYQFGPGCVTLTAAPQFHTAGLNSFSLASLYKGGAVAVMQNWDAEQALKYLADTSLRVTHTLGVPTQYHLMAQNELFKDITFPALKTAAVGGAPPTLTLLKTWADKGYPLMPGYGMTEVFGVATITPEEAVQKPGAVGRAQTLIQIRIADDMGVEKPRGTAGEIQLKGPGVTPGYWQQPEATQAAFIEGWFRTGDVGVMDEDGVLYLVDRKKDMFISGGENVYPVEIENVLARFPEIKTVAVIGVSHEKWGQVGKAIVVLKQDAVLEEKEMMARCRKELAAYKVPHSMEIVSSLPLSAQGKVLKTKLREQYGR